jgi:hypothetical protein
MIYRRKDSSGPMPNMDELLGRKPEAVQVLELENTHIKTMLGALFSQYGLELQESSVEIIHRTTQLPREIILSLLVESSKAFEIRRDSMKQN